MRIVAFVASVFVAGLTGISQPAANTVYIYSDSQTQFLSDPVFVTGTITTDGKVGVLTASDIISWDLIITGGGAVSPFTVEGPSSISSVTLTGAALSATATSLLWNNSVPSSNLFFGTDDHVLADFKGFIEYGTGFFLAIVLPGVCGTPGFGCDPFLTDTRSGIQMIATAATPLPGALPLFVGGLGALGLLRWRRKATRRDRLQP